MRSKVQIRCFLSFFFYDIMKRYRYGTGLAFCTESKYTIIFAGEPAQTGSFARQFMSGDRGKKWNKGWGWLLAAVFILVSGCWYAGAGGPELAVERSLTRWDEPEYRADVTVEIAGAVAHPGVYTLTNNATLGELIALAGGLSDGALADGLRMDDALFDREKVTVPRTGEEAGPVIGYRNLAEEALEAAEAETGKAGAQAEAKININTAGREELMTLPGLGETLADNILRYREEHGRFTTIDELTKVERFGAGLLERWRDRLVLE